MARPLRVNRANGWYHAYARGLNRMDLYGTGSRAASGLCKSISGVNYR